MAELEMLTILIIVLGTVGLIVARDRASMRSRRKISQGPAESER